MAAAPVGVMFMMLGLFLLLEIKAERVADPDSLSTRVRSEVYALPPLPTARSIRKLSESDADDQIEPVHPASRSPAFRGVRQSSRVRKRAMRADHQRHLR